jgi:hypothetical protein
MRKPLWNPITGNYSVKATPEMTRTLVSEIEIKKYIRISEK